MIFNNILGKSMIAVVLAIVTAAFIIGNIGPIFVGWSGLLLCALFSVVWIFIFHTLEGANSDNVALTIILFIVGSIMLGATLGNGILVTIYYVSILAGDVSELVDIALLYAAFATVVATIGGVFIARTVDYNKLVNSKILNVMFATVSGFAIAYLVAFVFALLGLDRLWMIVTTLTYGTGIIGIVFSVGAVAFMSYMLTVTIASTNEACKYPNRKEQEYFYALLIANSIILLFLDLFKLILKLLLIFSKD